ncbi:MAG: hypothetical protein J6M60_05955 [Clostridia bacterium]|nr:hypothetical protein [Clostridia bacterium]
MEKEEIMKRFQKKGFDQEEIQMFLGAIEDFKKIKLDKYVPIREVVDRICNNLDNVEYTEMEGTTLGKFKKDKKLIQLSEEIREDKEKLKSVFFHELTHCITCFKELDMVGFHSTVENPLEPETKYTEGYGLNEGVTSYLERKRNKANNFEGINSYPILNSLVENLILVVGEEKIMDSYFNNPEELEELLENYGIDCFAMVDGFDAIYENEKKIYRIKNPSKAEKLLAGFLGESQEKRLYDLIGEPLRRINSQLFEAIEGANNVKDFEKISKFIKRLEEQKYGIDKDDIYSRLLKDKRRILRKGCSEEEINKVLEENGLKDSIELQEYFEQLIEDDKNDTLIQLYDRYYEKNESQFFDIKEKPSYNKKILKSLFLDETTIRLEDIIVVGKILKDHPEIDIDEISLKEYEEGFFIVDTMKEKRFAYLYGKDVEEFTSDNTVELKNNVIGQGSKIEIKDDEIIFYDKFHKEGIVSKQCGELKSNYEVEKEYAERNIKAQLRAIEEFENMGAPSIIIDSKNEVIKKNKDRLEKMKLKIQNRGKNQIIKSKEIECFEGELKDVEKADKKNAELKSNIRMIQEEKNNGQNIGEDE